MKSLTVFADFLNIESSKSHERVAQNRVLVMKIDVTLTLPVTGYSKDIRSPAHGAGCYCSCGGLARISSRGPFCTLQRPCQSEGSGLYFACAMQGAPPAWPGPCRTNICDSDKKATSLTMLLLKKCRSLAFRRNDKIKGSRERLHDPTGRHTTTKRWSKSGEDEE